MLAAGVSRTGASPAGATFAGAAAGAVSEVAALGVVVSVTLVLDSPGCAAIATEFESADGWVCGWSSPDDVCSKAPRAAAFSGVRFAQAEIKLAARTRYRPTKNLFFFINLPIVTSSCEHV